MTSHGVGRATWTDSDQPQRVRRRRCGRANMCVWMGQGRRRWWWVRRWGPCRRPRWWRDGVESGDAEGDTAAAAADRTMKARGRVATCSWGWFLIQLGPCAVDTCPPQSAISVVHEIFRLSPELIPVYFPNHLRGYQILLLSHPDHEMLTFVVPIPLSKRLYFHPMWGYRIYTRSNSFFGELFL